MIAGWYEQLDTDKLQDQEPVKLQPSPEATRFAIDPLPTGDVYITVRWFDAEMAWEAQPSGRRGRQQACSDAAIQAYLTIKVLFGLPLRQTTGFVESLLELVGLDWAVPDFSTLCRRQRALPVAIPYRGSAGPLNLLVDSTGIKAEGEGEWNARKHPSRDIALQCPAGQGAAPNADCGARYTSIARQANVPFAERGGDEETLEVRAIEVTSSSIGDAPMLPDLPDQIPSDEKIGTVTADGAYDTRKCHDVIAARNAHAVIPPRKNAKLWRPDTAGAPLGRFAPQIACRAMRARNEAVRSSKYLDRALWRQLTGYHRRSRVETNPLGTLLRNTLPGSECIV